MTLTLPIYLDHHSTTPVDPRVVSAMLPYFTEVFGNPSSRTHAFGWNAAAALESARATIAGAIGAEARELVFTSGGTEANNLALKGAAEVYGGGNRRRFVTQATEHSSVLEPLARLAAHGFSTTVLPVDGEGRVDVDAARRALADDPLLVSVMLANNEVGTLQPVAEIAALARARGVLVHCDATQALGRVPIDVDALGVDLLSLSAHKVYGPKGVGALFVRRRRPAVRLGALLDGGGQERGMRSGTHNLPGIVGFARAVELALDDLPREARRIADLRDRLQGALTERLAGVAIHGSPTARLCGNLNASFDGIDAEELARALPDLAVSTGSACASGRGEPSHVLRAMGVSPERARAALRFGIGRFTTTEEIDHAADLVVRAVIDTRIRAAGLEEAAAGIARDDGRNR